MSPGIAAAASHRCLLKQQLPIKQQSQPVPRCGLIKYDCVTDTAKVVASVQCWFHRVHCLQDSVSHQAEEQRQKQARAHRRMQKLQRDMRCVLLWHELNPTLPCVSHADILSRATPLNTGYPVLLPLSLIRLQCTPSVWVSQARLLMPSSICKGCSA